MELFLFIALPTHKGFERTSKNHQHWFQTILNSKYLRDQKEQGTCIFTALYKLSFSTITIFFLK